MSHNKIEEALRANGVDLGSVTTQKDNRPIPAEAVYGAITDLANEAIKKTTVTIVEKANKYKEVAGMTIDAIDTMKEFEDEILKQEKMARSVLESVRSLKSAMALEMQFLDKAVKQIANLNIRKTIEDLDRLKTLAESATIKKLFGQ